MFSLLGNTNLMSPSAFMGPGRWRMRMRPLSTASRLSSDSVVTALPSPVTNSKPCRLKYAGSRRSRGTVSRLAMDGGTFQYGLNSM
ncbi:hypothetical protein D9M68_947810 [compost metagenome]